MFSWWDSKQPSSPTSAQGRRHAQIKMSERRAEMYRRELEERAALLQRLGYSPKQAKQRLLANVHWDFELHAKPKHSGEVERIVDGVYRRGGVASGTPSV